MWIDIGKDMALESLIRKGYMNRRMNRLKAMNHALFGHT